MWLCPHTRGGTELGGVQKSFSYFGSEGLIWWGMMALRKVESGRLKNFDQNPPKFWPKKREFRGKFPPGELTVKISTSLLISVTFHTPCQKSCLLRLCVGHVTVCVRLGRNFGPKTQKMGAFPPIFCVCCTEQKCNISTSNSSHFEWFQVVLAMITSTLKAPASYLKSVPLQQS